MAMLEGDAIELDIVAEIHGDECFDLRCDEGHGGRIFAFFGQIAEDAGGGIEMPFSGGVEKSEMVFEMVAGLLLEVRHRVVGGGGLTDGVAEEGLFTIEVDGLKVDTGKGPIVVEDEFNLFGAGPVLKVAVPEEEG